MDKRKKSRRRRKRRLRWKKLIGMLLVAALILGALIFGIAVLLNGGINELGGKVIPGFAASPSDVLRQYVNCLQVDDYDGMYELLSSETKDSLSRSEFEAENRKVYDAIGLTSLDMTFPQDPEVELEDGIGVTCTMKLQTCAGVISFDQTVKMKQENGHNRLVWNKQVIFPDLCESDEIRVSSSMPERGCIYDRDGNLLAGNGLATSIGLVPGKLEEDSVKRLAEVLDSTEESIQDRLSASWVKEDSFVPIRTVEKLTDRELSSPGANTAEKKDLVDALNEIPGVLLRDVEVRIYPEKEIMSHLIGYVQTISAEELAADKSGFYNSSSVIGKSGLESAYETRLRGIHGHRISIVTAQGDVRKVLAVSNPVAGENITLTIDTALQRMIYDTYKDHQTATAAINPNTGEVLALVSTPSYDSNLFVMGLRSAQWDAWNEDPANPLLNRFKAAWTPGSSMKSITAAIGVTSGKLDPDADLESSGSWQANAGWGKYEVTTLHVSSPSNLMNSLIVSDNVYYAKAAVMIGSDTMEAGWKSMGFDEDIPFPISMTDSSFSSTDHLADEIQLADSGYGQGQMQVNPLHMAAMYSAFVNDGSMVLPHLELSEETTMWKKNVISSDAADRVAQALRLVVSNAYGTAHSALMEELPLAGKTGTAELKVSREDEEGSEIGWFTSYALDRAPEDTLLLSTMVEEAQKMGGSGFVVRCSKNIYRQYYGLDQPDEDSSDEESYGSYDEEEDRDDDDEDRDEDE